MFAAFTMHALQLNSSKYGTPYCGPRCKSILSSYMILCGGDFGSEHALKRQRMADGDLAYTGLVARVKATPWGDERG